MPFTVSPVHKDMKSIIDTHAKGLEPGDLTLTCTALRFVNWDSGDADFVFLAGADKVCRVHTVLAEFLSPKVANIRRCDPFCYCYKFNNFELLDVSESLVSSLRTGVLHVWATSSHHTSTKSKVTFLAIAISKLPNFFSRILRSKSKMKIHFMTLSVFVQRMT